MKRTRAPLFGDDVFISYKRSDAADYALALASELTKHKLSCFLEQWGTPPGEELPEPLKRRIRKSGLFVLLGTAGAAISELVRQEVEEFLETGRAIIPITFPDEGFPEKGSLARASWFKRIEGLALARESAEGPPSRAASGLGDRPDGQRGGIHFAKPASEEELLGHRKSANAFSCSVSFVPVLGCVSSYKGRS